MNGSDSGKVKTQARMEEYKTNKKIYTIEITTLTKDGIHKSKGITKRNKSDVRKTEKKNDEHEYKKLDKDKDREGERTQINHRIERRKKRRRRRKKKKSCRKD